MVGEDASGSWYFKELLEALYNLFVSMLLSGLLRGLLDVLIEGLREILEGLRL